MQDLINNFIWLNVWKCLFLSYIKHEFCIWTVLYNLNIDEDGIEANIYTADPVIMGRKSRQYTIF